MEQQISGLEAYGEALHRLAEVKRVPQVTVGDVRKQVLDGKAARKENKIKNQPFFFFYIQA